MLSHDILNKWICFSKFPEHTLFEFDLVQHIIPKTAVATAAAAVLEE